MKRYTRIYIDMTEYVNVTVRNEDSHYACETELQTAPKLELEFHRRLSPSHKFSLVLKFLTRRHGKRTRRINIEKSSSFDQRHDNINIYDSNKWQDQLSCVFRFLSIFTTAIS